MNIGAMPSKLKSPWVFLPFIVIVVASLATVWFFYNFEKKEYTYHTGISPLARRNPLLAAEAYLRKIGHQSESVKGMDIFSHLPPITDAILIRRIPEGISKSITSNLLNWVENGGHLLVIPNRNTSDHPGNDSLFKQLGVKLEESKSDCGCPTSDEKETENKKGNLEVTPEDSSEDNQDNQSNTSEKKDEQPTDNVKKVEDEPGPSNDLIHVELDGNEIQLETFNPRLLADTNNTANFRIDGSYRINYEEEKDKSRSDQNKLVTEEGAWLLQYSRGIGKVTVLSEMSLFYNYRIEDFDHAYFLSWLSQDDDKVWLLYSTGVDSFLKILWQKVPKFWLSLLVVLVLLLWRLQMQSGSRLRPGLNDSYNIMHHIDATAQYSWRTNNLAKMVQKNRKALLNMLLNRKIGLQAERQQKEIDIVNLAKKTGLTENQLHGAFKQVVETDQDLIQISSLLQHIRKLITGGDKRKK